MVYFTSAMEHSGFLARQSGRILACLIVLGVLLILGPAAFAQTYIEPSTPLGGTTAAPLTTSDSIQRKAGSLIIGTDGGSSQLCLNANTIEIPNQPNSATTCISSWGELGIVTSGQYVVVYKDDWTVDPPAGGSVLGPEPAQSGYARIQASQPDNQLYSIIAEAPNLSNSAGVYATDNGANTWAAYLRGRVYIGDGTAGSSKKLCLNDSVDYNPTGSPPNLKGCITTWNDISVPLGSQYVILQPAPGPLVVQTGGEALTGAGVFGSDPAVTIPPLTGGVVLGVPPPGSSICLTCGDGVCNSPTETDANCPSTGPAPDLAPPNGCLWTGGQPQVPRGDCAP